MALIKILAITTKSAVAGNRVDINRFQIRPGNMFWLQIDLIPNKNGADDLPPLGESCEMEDTNVSLSLSDALSSASFLGFC